MKYLLSLLLALSMHGTLAAQQRSPARLSPRTQLYLHRAQAVQPGYVYKRVNGELCLSALLRTGPGFEQSRLRDLGIHVGTRAGRILTVQVPVSQLPAFAQLPGIDYLQLDEPIHPTLDSVRKTTLVDTVHSGWNLPQAFSGAGVVVGIIDVGFDYTHPAFMDTGGTRFRIRRVWEQQTAGTPPAGYAYGAEYTDSAAIRNAGTDNAAQTHGTHVAGIAAGSGHGSGGRYRGVAYASDLVMVGITPPKEQWMNTGMADVIDGIAYIYRYAASQGRPAVANLSWGCTVGSHDGRSLFSEACDSLTGAGRLFAISAGNNGGQQVHFEKTFTAVDTMGEVQTYVPISTPAGKRIWIDAWGESGQTYCLEVPGHGTGFLCTQQDSVYRFLYTIGNGDTVSADIVVTAAAYNGRPRIFMEWFSESTGELLFRVKGSGGTLHAWNGYVHESTGYYGTFANLGYSGPWHVTISDKYAVGDMASTASALTVGAYAPRVSFTNISNGIIGAYQYVMNGINGRGDIARFSSRGPSLDGRTKPDIAAPGLCIASAFNSYAADYRPGGGNYSLVTSDWLHPVSGRRYFHGGLNGTSMASPAAAGILALMLEARPDLRPDTARDILTATALKDAFTGPLVVPDHTWGGGKINAFAALKRSLRITGVGRTAAGTIDCSIYPNPSAGHCSVRYRGARAERLQLTLYNAEGRQVYSTHWAVTAGTQNREFDFSSLRPGLYFARITGGEGAALLRMVLR